MTVKIFTLANTNMHNVQFLVTGNEFGSGSIGVLGQNFLGQWDVDYDLAGGAVRLITPTGCGERSLAYWAGDKPWSVISLERKDGVEYVGDIKAAVYVNGRRLEGLFDTGSPFTFLTKSAAAQAGVTSKDANVQPAGVVTGIGRQTAATWIGRFKSFKIGEEEVTNVKLRFSDVDIPGADIILGKDFFMAHHILVSNSQQKIYFTYNGGPVFDLNSTPEQK